MKLESFNGEGGSYRVLYKSEYDSSSGPWRNATVDNPKSRFYILDKLEAYTRYTVQVISVNIKYQSQRSNEASSQTIEYGK